MTIHQDAWHYPRRELAEDFLRRFDPGPAEALTLFAERRSGKTAFLKNDLSIEAIAQELQPVYIDLWANRGEPGRAIADGLEAAARTLKDPKYKYGSILGRFDQQITSIGAFGASIGMKTREDAPAPTDTLSRISFWADQMVANTKRPVVLMIDEIQTLAGGQSEQAVNVASALRAALQKHGRLAIRPVFTGSSRDGLQRLFNQSNAAFYNYGSSPKFPSPDDGIAQFMRVRMRQSSGIDVPTTKLLAAFNQLDRRPGPFRAMVAAMDNEDRDDIETFVQRQLGEMQAQAWAREDMAGLRPLDKIVLEVIRAQLPLFGAETAQYISERLGLDESAPRVNPKSINDSISKMRAAYLVTRVGRGQYLIEDREIADLVNERLPPELKGVAPALAGNETTVLPARAGATYRGPIVHCDTDTVTQDVDGVLIQHERDSLFGHDIDALLSPGPDDLVIQYMDGLENGSARWADADRVHRGDSATPNLKAPTP